MLLSLERVVSGGGSNIMTEVIVNAVKKYGGIKASDLSTRLASFGAGKCVSFSCSFPLFCDLVARYTLDCIRLFQRLPFLSQIFLCLELARFFRYSFNVVNEPTKERVAC